MQDPNTEKERREFEATALHLPPPYDLNVDVLGWTDTKEHSSVLFHSNSHSTYLSKLETSVIHLFSGVFWRR